MAHYDHLIIGGGMTADAAVRGIRSEDPEASIGVVSSEADPPYDRPPLTKGLWKGQDVNDVGRGTEDLDVDLHLDRTVTRIDREAGTATDDRGTVYSYGKLLLATGATPRELDDGPPQVNYLRTLDDYRRLRKQVDEGATVAVIGGGFTGSEISASLVSNGVDVTLLFPEDGIAERVLPGSVSAGLVELFEDRGVDVRTGTAVASVRRSGPELLVAVEGGSSPALRVGAVVAGLGVVPNVGLAEAAGLEVDDGIVVDAGFRTDDPRVFAAGDCAAFWSPVLGKRLRIEHEDHANSSGMTAGRAMAGADVEYDYLPFFYSDLFDVGYEAVGELDPQEMELVEDWEEASPMGDRPSGVSLEEASGAVYYLSDRRVRGVLLWNKRGKLKKARSLIRDTQRVIPSDLRGALD